MIWCCEVERMFSNGISVNCNPVGDVRNDVSSLSCFCASAIWLKSENEIASIRLSASATVLSFPEMWANVSRERTNVVVVSDGFREFVFVGTRKRVCERHLIGV